MGTQRVRLDKDTLRTTDKTPPFSDDMRHDAAISFEAFKFRQEDLHTAAVIKNGNAADGGTTKKTIPKSSGKRSTAGKRGKPAAKGGKGAEKATAAKAFAFVRGVGGKVDEYSDKYNEELQRERKDNLGLRAVDESKTAIVRTKRVLDTGVKTTRDAIKYTGKAAQTTGKVAQKTAEAAKKAVEVASQITQKVAAAVAKFIAFLAANPLVLVALVIIVLLVLLTFQTADAVQNTPKNIMGEELYADVQEYLREKDRELLIEFEDYENRQEFEGIDEEDITKEMEVYPATSMKLISSYLCAKYDGTLTLDIAKQEIDEIHAQLYRIEHEVSTEEYEVEEPVLDAKGKPVLNADGTPKTKKVKKEKQLLTVTLTGQTLKQYFDDNLDSLLTKQKIASYDWFVFVSGLWNNGEFSPPFEDENYMAHVTQEYGVPSYANPTRPHRGIDIAYPEGTPILNILGGTVVEVSHHWSWGLTVVIESEDGTYRVRYAHMSAVSVGVGDFVATGEPVGLVGNTGVSSGPHLHLEVEENGQLINPREVLPVDLKM